MMCSLAKLWCLLCTSVGQLFGFCGVGNCCVILLLPGLSVTCVHVVIDYCLSKRFSKQC